MSWNYRVTRETKHTDEKETIYEYAIREIYYDEKGNPKAWSKEPQHPHGETWTELAEDVRRMLQALAAATYDMDTETWHPPGSQA